MKKLIGILLIIAMLAGFSALAEDGENLVDKDISFGIFKLGGTFDEARAAEYISGISFNAYAYTGRMVGDAYGDNMVYYVYGSDHVAQSFSAWGDSKTVAGYDVSPRLYFTYPIVDGHFQQDENTAVLIGGQYEFSYDIDAESAFTDLQSKLTSTYGDPWKESTSADELWGAVELPDNYEWIKDDIAQLDAHYVVWKSSTNGVEVVLSVFTRYDERRVSLSYIYPAMDEEIIAAHNNVQSTASTSTDGL